MTRPDPAKIIVPRRHGEVLIEPPLAEQQRAMARGEWGFTDVNHSALRRMARGEFFTLAERWAKQTGVNPPLLFDDPDKPFIITGHQVEFYHAGVWAKVIAADELAKRVGGIAFDLLVDHDLVDHRGFDVPVRPGEGPWRRQPVEFSPASPLPVEGLSAPSLEEFLNWDADLAAHAAAQSDSLAFFLSALRRPGAPPATTYTDWMSSARARFEASLHIQVHHVPTSLLCTTRSWRVFVNAWIQNADAWTAAYNRHLARYRQVRGIKNPQHPMPDLVRASDSGSQTFELPFWMNRPGQPRQRLILRKKGERIAFVIDEFEHILKDGVGQWPALIRPRALTLTMFTRLFLADLFIHGIGGALYDQITDELMRELFGAAPPYACVSAAWLLPMGQRVDTGGDVGELLWQRHHVLHNPQIAIDPFTALRTEIAEMIRDRRLLVEQIAHSLTAARRDSAARRERREWFNALHAINGTLHERAPKLLGKLDQQIEEVRRTALQNKVLSWREYFFGLHATASLGQLISKIRNG